MWSLFNMSPSWSPLRCVKAIPTRRSHNLVMMMLKVLIQKEDLRGKIEVYMYPNSHNTSLANS